MEWILRSPQIHSTFGNLGFSHGEGYQINENCNGTLETILHNILTEDKYLRAYRRSISFGQNIQKDIIPLLLNTTDDKTIELLIRILVNLTIPMECLFSVDVISKTDFGRHTIFEINNLLAAAKNAFTDHRVTKVVIKFLKKNVDFAQSVKLTPDQCVNIGNGLFLLRNILHIPEETTSNHTVQNQILWNIFSQSIDKVLIKLMTIPESTNWSVTMVQVIALLYKDQHFVKLHKLLNLWLEASLSESSEDNESNTSPPDRGSEDSSPMLTSDPTSDSSDMGGSGKSNGSPKNDTKTWRVATTATNQQYEALPEPPPPPLPPPPQLPARLQKANEHKTQASEGSNANVAKRKLDETKTSSSGDDSSQFNGQETKRGMGESSDCGYGTQIENQESVSTSSNEDEPRKPIHQKPHNTKQKPNTKIRIGTTLHDRKRKKIVKRTKATIINVQGLSRKTPTDDDISHVLKEFTIDFLLKGYNSLVRTLHSQVTTNLQLEIDTSHFFWLVTYFLKFATQIELDLEHICSVLSFDIVAYLTAEGVNLCEQFELAIRPTGSDLKSSIRRLHLVVTAIREFVQAIEVYKKLTMMSSENRETLMKLQHRMCEMEELRSLMVLLLRHFNPCYHNKQYLQDLVVTNHILLTLIESVTKLPDYKGPEIMMEHMQQFATPEMMHQYGFLLENYAENGEFVNDCVFTIMHHVGGELKSLKSLFQPSILKTFTTIWQSDFETCDDWTDLIEYVINTFIKKPNTLKNSANFCFENEYIGNEKKEPKPSTSKAAEPEVKRKTSEHSYTTKEECWTDTELSSLSWYYMQCNSLQDVVGEIVKMLKDDGCTKSRVSVITELYLQNCISSEEHSRLMSKETGNSTFSHQNRREDDVGKLCNQMIQNGKSKFLVWLQKVLLDTCFAKIYIERTKESNSSDTKIMKFELFKKKPDAIPQISPVAYHSLLTNKFVPLVPWNGEQASICKDLKFLRLLNLLGFHMPVDTGKVFISMPDFWTAEHLYEMAGKILPIDTSKLSFSINDISDSGGFSQSLLSSCSSSSDIAKRDMLPPTENFFQYQKQNHLVTMVNFTPTPSNAYEGVSAPGEVNKPCWLDIVQRSQELNKVPHSIAKLGDDVLPTDGCLDTTNVDVMIPMSPPILPIDPISASTSGMLLPTVINIDDHDSQPLSNSALCDFEDNNSVCDTASVALNLTRMYVSDEDEKSDVVTTPSVASSCRNPPPGEESATADTDACNACKRPRVHFTPHF